MVLEEISLKTRFNTVRNQSLAICQPLTPEDHVVQPVVDVSPPKWHLGHTTWFFETFILVPYAEHYQCFDDNYSYLFNSYYETVGARVIRTDRGNMTRPSVRDILRYREHVDEALEKFLDGELAPNQLNLIELGLQHEQQHQELLLYDIKYILGNNPLFPEYLPGLKHLHCEQRKAESLEIPEGIYSIGYDKEGFYFDNERGVHKVYLHGCKIEDRLITNGEYLEFMFDGGYEDFRHWLSEGWDWVNTNQIKGPFHWHQSEGEWMVYSLRGGLRPVELNEPVTHISFFEADAYAKWRKKRLLTEFEWEVACNQFGNIDDHSNFSERESFAPNPALPNQNQLFGDVWEWTSSAYRPYPFYEAPEGAVGEYNGKFMVNQMVLRGGSCATSNTHIRATYRNFFHPHLRWMFSGIRLASDL
ncbi:MAG: ergothioneine biosynthesis protein EgtB [Bacteroidota bacterium]